MPFYYYWDPTYVLVIAAMLLSMFASFGVNATFNKYKKLRTVRNITGAEAARRVTLNQGWFSSKSINL